MIVRTRKTHFERPADIGAPTVSNRWTRALATARYRAQHLRQDVAEGLRDLAARLDSEVRPIDRERK